MVDYGKQQESPLSLRLLEALQRFEHCMDACRICRQGGGGGGGGGRGCAHALPAPYSSPAVELRARPFMRMLCNLASCTHSDRHQSLSAEISRSCMHVVQPGAMWTRECAHRPCALMM